VEELAQSSFRLLCTKSATDCSHYFAPSLSALQRPPNGRAALPLSGCSPASLCSGLQRWNSFQHFRDEKLSLQLRHILGYDVSTRRRNVVGNSPGVSFSTTISRSIAPPKHCAGSLGRCHVEAARLPKLDRHGAISSGDTWDICVDIPSCARYAPVHEDSHKSATGKTS
jgi:hypothetical protein